MRKLVLWLCAGVAAVTFGLGASVVEAGKKANVKIVNKSDWDIHHMMVAPSKSDEWGPDQLGKHVISAKGGEFTLTDIPCDTYDVKLIDEDGDECEVTGVDICGKSDTWVINTKDLLACQGWGK